MLQFSRAKTAVILLTVLVICGFGVPNFLSAETLQDWPEWAQRRLVLSPELQGGTYLQLEVDRSDLRALVLASLRREVRSTLREAHIGLVRPAALRGDSIEVRPRDTNFQAGLAKLRELSQSFNGVRLVDVVDAGGGLIQVTPTDGELAVREQQSIDQSILILGHRMSEGGVVGGAVWQTGAGRIALQMPRVTDPNALSP